MEACGELLFMALSCRVFFCRRKNVEVEAKVCGLSIIGPSITPRAKFPNAALGQRQDSFKVSVFQF
jgi:hypothetical protein